MAVPKVPGREAAVAAATPFISGFEGRRGEPYRDICGYWTIGVGHLISKNTALPKPDISLNDAGIDKLLASDLGPFYASLLRLLPHVGLSLGQMVALLSFVFNLGAGNLQASALRQKLLRGDYQGAAIEFLKWCRANHRTVAGLLRRRQAEKALFEQGISR